jgi:hypothetical protein
MACRELWSTAAVPAVAVPAVAAVATVAMAMAMAGSSISQEVGSPALMRWTTPRSQVPILRSRGVSSAKRPAARRACWGGIKNGKS